VALFLGMADKTFLYQGHLLFFPDASRSAMFSPIFGAHSVLGTPLGPPLASPTAPTAAARASKCFIPRLALGHELLGVLVMVTGIVLALHLGAVRLLLP
jgi:hypothetical protein